MRPDLIRVGACARARPALPNLRSFCRRRCILAANPASQGKKPVSPATPVLSAHRRRAPAPPQLIAPAQRHHRLPRCPPFFRPFASFRIARISRRSPHRDRRVLASSRRIREGAAMKQPERHDRLDRQGAAISLKGDAATPLPAPAHTARLGATRQIRWQCRQAPVLRGVTQGRTSQADGMPPPVEAGPMEAET